jgi:hypothetical protein
LAYYADPLGGRICGIVYMEFKNETFNISVSVSVGLMVDRSYMLGIV